MFSFPQIGGDGERHILVGRLNLVDMAGSERPPKSAMTVSWNAQLFLRGVLLFKYMYVDAKVLSHPQYSL